MKKILYLLLVIATTACTKKDNKRTTTLSLTAAASDMGLLFEHKYRIVVYNTSGVDGSDSITFHADSTVTEKLYNDTTQTWVAYMSVATHPSARNNTAIQIGMPSTSYGWGELTQHLGDTVNLGYIGYYTSGPVYNVDNRASLGIMLSGGKYAILY